MKARRRKFGKAEVTGSSCRKATCSSGHDLAAGLAESELTERAVFSYALAPWEQRAVA
jgi:hypothetical protein